MQRITIEGQLENAIKSSREPIELCDASGAVIAVVWPGERNDDPPLPTMEELATMMAGPKYNTEHVIRELEAL